MAAEAVESGDVSFLDNPAPELDGNRLLHELFEARVMKMSTVDIGSRVSIGSGTVILYGTVIEDDVKVGDLSLLMKGERLYRGTESAGSPLQRCAHQ